MVKISRLLLLSAILTTSLAPASVFATTPTPNIKITSPRAVPNSLGTITNATLMSKADTTLTVRQGSTSITVTTDSSTRFRRKFWGNATLAELQLGDTLNILGRWQDSNQTLIQAKLIRDESIQKVNGVFIGTIQSINGTVLTIETLNRGTQTMTLNSATKITNRTNLTLTQSDILVGHKVRVRGLWDKTNNTVTDITKIKDYSLPH